MGLYSICPMSKPHLSGIVLIWTYSSKILKHSLSISRLLVLALILLGCTIPEKQNFTFNELKMLDKVDRVEIQHRVDFLSTDQHVKTITKPEQVNLIVNVFRTYADGWESYHPYAPPGLLTVKFYSGLEYKLGIMIGYTENRSLGTKFFHLSQPFGLGRPLGEHEFKELMNLLKVDESLAYYD